MVAKKNQENAINLLMDSLYQLQNRGYDSFGIMTNNNNEINIDKMACLEKNDTFENFKERNLYIKSNIAVGHTRWATHGSISEDNAHPHYSNSNMFYLVHNGIIENYVELKKKLLDKKYTFYSDTDSEVVANLIEYHYNKLINNYLDKNNDNINDIIYNSILNACDELEGTYGLVINCVYDLNSIYIIRKGSPIIIGEKGIPVIKGSSLKNINKKLIETIKFEDNIYSKYEVI